MSTPSPSRQPADDAWRIGADIGGTFTDIVALGPNRMLRRIKVLSTPGNYSLAISKTLHDDLDDDARRATASFIHGTTIATNTILEDKAPAVALITTAGFRDVLEIRRSRRPNLYDLTWQPPPALVPRRLRWELDERMATDGSVLVPLQDDDIDRCIAAIASQPEHISAIAVCLINSFANPEHEERVAVRLRQALPTTKVTISSALIPEPREFERTSTTVVNALLLPVVDDYLTTLERSLAEIQIGAPVHVMQSDGTTVTSGLVRSRPFAIIESGPAAGVVAAARLAEEMGRPSVIAFDMGGTTAKAALIEDFRPSFTDELEVGDSLNRASGLTRGSGYAVRSPCVDLSEVGAGGGSIAWVDGGGALRVGPASAGAEPGPACYGNGGVDATVTDAHVVLGYLNPEAIAGGTKRIYAERAHQAVAGIASRLQLSVPDAAFGIYSVVNSNMRRAVRTVSVERGRDPRTFSLFAFGGAGGLHAAALAAEVEMPEVVIPIVPGLFSSLGLLFSELAVTRVAAHRAPLSAVSLGMRFAWATTWRRAPSRSSGPPMTGPGRPPPSCWSACAMSGSRPRCSCPSTWSRRRRQNWPAPSTTSTAESTDRRPRTSPSSWSPCGPERYGRRRSCSSPRSPTGSAPRSAVGPARRRASSTSAPTSAGRRPASCPGTTSARHRGLAPS
jgi:N-methylhydantoinase A